MSSEEQLLTMEMLWNELCRLNSPLGGFEKTKTSRTQAYNLEAIVQSEFWTHGLEPCQGAWR